MIMTLLVLQLSIWNKASNCDGFFLTNHQPGRTTCIKKGFIYLPVVVEGGKSVYTIGNRNVSQNKYKSQESKA